jgi:hypothetical protein
MKKIKWLVLSSLLASALTACPIPVAPPTTAPTFTACSNATPGLVGVQVGSSVEYSFQGLLFAPFGNLSAGTAFAGKIRYPYPQPTNGGAPNPGGYLASYTDLQIGSDSVFVNDGRVYVHDDSPITANGDGLILGNQGYMSGYVGGLQLKSTAGMGLILQGASSIFSTTTLPGVGLQSSNFTSAELVLTDINGFTVTSQLCQ